MEELDLKALDYLRGNSIEIKVLSCILSYPTGDLRITVRRLEKLIEIGLDKILFTGKTKVCGVNILGKGTNSLVLKCLYRNCHAAIKILRIDADRSTLRLEASILNKLSPYRIAPNLYKADNWFLIEEFIDGIPIIEFAEMLEKEDAENIRRVISNIICKAILLDLLGIDHGELTRPNKHVIISPEYEVYFIDFESASMVRRPKNLTSIMQYLFNNPLWRHYLIKFTGIDSKEKLIDLLRAYKVSKDPKLIYNKLGIECINLQESAPP